MMKTKTALVRDVVRDAAVLHEAGEIIKAGGLVAFPTETVYGLGGDALNPLSSGRIYEAKGRPRDNPLIVHICKKDSLFEIAREVPDKALALAEAFWPGPLTMILKKKEAVPPETTGGLDTVAVRMPDHEAALKLIEEAGGFVAAPSANTSGRPSPTEAAHVLADLDGRIDMILDCGETVIGLESTIVDLTSDRPAVLRPGYITEELLEEIIGPVEIDPGLSDRDRAPKAPGMKYRHYAPKAEVTIISGAPERVREEIERQVKMAQEQGRKAGIMASAEAASAYTEGIVLTVGRREDPDTIARQLYRVLRRFDEEGAEVVFSESFEDLSLSSAIMNRLLKAAGHRVIRV